MFFLQKETIRKQSPLSLFNPLTDQAPWAITTMSDQSATATPSAPPPAPTGPPPKVSNRGRTVAPNASSNFDAADIPEFEHFGTVGPRGLPPLTGKWRRLLKSLKQLDQLCSS